MSVLTTDKFETFETCPVKYYFKYIKNIVLPDNEDGFKLGKNVHALVNYFLKNQNLEKLNIPPNEQKHFDSIKNSVYAKYELIASEWGFETRIGNGEEFIVGRIDAIFKNKNEFMILDWKTGQNFPQKGANSLQCLVYLYAFFLAQKDLKLNFDYDNLKFIFFKTPNGETLEVRYSKELHQKTEKMLENLVLNIKDFENSPDITPQKEEKKCRYCNFSAICEG